MKVIEITINHINGTKTKIDDIYNNKISTNESISIFIKGKEVLFKNNQFYKSTGRHIKLIPKEVFVDMLGGGTDLTIVDDNSLLLEERVNKQVS